MTDATSWNFADAVCIAPPPFPALPCVYVLVGLGVAYQDAGANAWVAGLPDSHRKLVSRSLAEKEGARAAADLFD